MNERTEREPVIPPLTKEDVLRALRLDIPDAVVRAIRHNRFPDELYKDSKVLEAIRRTIKTLQKRVDQIAPGMFLNAPARVYLKFLKEKFFKKD